MSRPHTLKMLNKVSVSQLAELSNLSKAYISQVKHGKRPPSKKLIEALLKFSYKVETKLPDYDFTLKLFLKSRKEGISPNTLRDYKITLSKALNVLGLVPTTAKINRFLSALPCSLGGKYGYFKCMRAFYNWLYSPRSNLDYKTDANPITWVETPKRPQLILPSLTKEQVELLLCKSVSVRDKAIIALFTESGLRLSELTNISPQDIDWQNRTMESDGQGQKGGICSVW